MRCRYKFTFHGILKSKLCNTSYFRVVQFSWTQIFDKYELREN